MIKTLKDLAQQIYINLLPYKSLSKKITKMEEDFVVDLEKERKRKQLELIDDRIKSYETVMKYTGKSTIKKKASAQLKYWQQARKEYDELHAQLSELEDGDL